MQQRQSQNAIAVRVLERLQRLPAPLQQQVLDFTDFLLSRCPQASQPQPAIAPGTLTGLRGILKQSSTTFSEEEANDEYTNYLLQKYR